MTLPEVAIHGQSDASPTITYQYDGFGRVATVTDPRSYNTTYEYDAMHRVTEVNSAGISETLYEYDAARNMTEAPSPADGSVKYKYVVDAWNRLVKVTDAMRLGRFWGKSRLGPPATAVPTAIIPTFFSRYE